MEKKTLNLPIGPRRFLKKRTILAVTICLCLVIAAFTFLVPRGAAKIPLELSYTVGEKMVYHTTEKINIQIINADLSGYEENDRRWTDQTQWLNFTEVIEVADFDGERYTLKHSQAISGMGIPSFSYEEKVNKTGYSTRIYPPSPNAESTNKSGVSNPALTAFIEKTEVTVGDTWEVPVNSNSSSISTTGNMTLTFVGIEDLTVPAGTFTVFRVDTRSDTVVQLRIPQWNTTSERYMTITGQTYLDYDTGRQIQRDLHIKSTQPNTNQNIGSNQSGNAAYTAYETKVQTQLIEIIKPGENSTTGFDRPSPLEQSALSFLRNIAGINLDHYSTQFRAASDGSGTAKCTLTSAESKLDATFIFNGTSIYWCMLYPLNGSTIFLESSTNNLEAAKSLLDRYQAQTQASYIPVFRSMIDQFNWLDETTQGGTFSSQTQSFGGEEVKLELTVNQGIYRFSWRLENGNPYQSLFAVEIRDGHFQFFTDSYINQGIA